MGVCFSKRAPDSPGTPGDSIAEQRARSFSKRTEMWERTGTVAVYVLLPRQSTAVADGFALLTRPSSRSSLSYLSSLAQSRVRRSPPRFPLNSRQSRRGK